jgi:hypothetical protein
MRLAGLRIGTGHGRASARAHSGQSIFHPKREGLQLIRRAKPAPVPALRPDRHVDFAHHDGLAVANVAGVALDQTGAQFAAGRIRITPNLGCANLIRLCFDAAMGAS